MRVAARTLRLALLAGVFVAAPAAAQDRDETQGHTVTVAVGGARSDAGHVLANLCDSPQAVFCATYRASAAASPAGTTLSFEGVAPGRYAVTAFHDENDDGQTQIPPEGYAFGNDAAFPPTFETASIDVSGDTAASLTMTYIAGAPVGVAAGGSEGAPAPDGVLRTAVRENGLYGAFYRPVTDEPVPAIILLGGSEGGLDTISSMAPSFALEGYGALALAYWGEQGLPPTLENVPLEYFDTAAAWLQAQPGVRADAIGALGWSRGSEAALLLAARNPAVRAVAGVAPSGVVWAGVDYADFVTAEPAWTADGAPLAFLSTSAANYRPGDPMTPLYLDALAEAASRPETEIPVENIDGPVLLISGGADALWPSATFAERIVARLERADFAHEVENLVYPDAGHIVFVGAPDGMMARTVGSAPRAMMGGSPEADAAAWADNWPRTLGFFDAALKN